MNYLELLNHSYSVAKTHLECPPRSRLEFLSEYIFDITTYDSEMAEFFGRNAVAVCAAINDCKTFEFINDAENYKWYLAMVNMPFFYDRITWGGSIRGAWWDGDIMLDSCGLWQDNEQLTELKFTLDEWREFIGAVVIFSDLDTGDGSENTL